MKERLKLRSLKEDDLLQMHAAFNKAFSDYSVHFRLSLEQFRKKFIEKLHISFPLSCGAFDGNQLAGFIFTNVSDYKGLRTAYNGGTGVVPGCRNKDLTGTMYKFLLPLFRKAGVQLCLLEVLSDNHRAIRAYEKSGFKKSRLYHCFKLNRKIRPLDMVPVRRVYQPDWEAYHSFADIAPSFLDSDKVLKHNLGNEKIIEAYPGGTFAGYAIYQPATGRISRMAVAPDFRNRGVGTSLLRYMEEDTSGKGLTIINIPHHARLIIDFLSGKGFENTLDQYEMIREV